MPLLQVLTGSVLYPYLLAFTDNVGLTDNSIHTNLIQVTLLATFTADLVLKAAFLAYYDDSGALVVQHRKICARFTSSLVCYVDLVSTIPWANIAWLVAGLDGSSSRRAHWLGLLLLVHNLRIYRLPVFFSELEVGMRVSRVAIAVMRNTFYLFLW